MNEDTFNMSLRKFLKQVGVTSQREIEEAVRKSGKTSGRIEVEAKVTATDIELDHTIRGTIDLG